MNLQYISNSKGKKTGVYIPMEDWKRLVAHIPGFKIFDQEEPNKAEMLEELNEALKSARIPKKDSYQLVLARELFDEL